MASFFAMDKAWGSMAGRKCRRETMHVSSRLGTLLNVQELPLLEPKRNFEDNFVPL